MKRAVGSNLDDMAPRGESSIDSLYIYIYVCERKILYGKIIR